MREPVRPTARQGQQGTLKVTNHVNPAHEEERAGENGLSHDGDLELEVIEEGDIEEDENTQARPRVLTAPRAPTQKEIDEHMATHLPHAAWCDRCIKERGRNTPTGREPRGLLEGRKVKKERRAPRRRSSKRDPSLQ